MRITLSSTMIRFEKLKYPVFFLVLLFLSSYLLLKKSQLQEKQEQEESEVHNRFKVFVQEHGVSPLVETGNSPNYLTVPPPIIFDGGGYGKPSDFEKIPNTVQSQTQDDAIEKYFTLIKTPNAFCRKLLRVGGKFWCTNRIKAITKLDGHKIICIDPEIQVGNMGPNIHNCLVLSFGIRDDTTFDEGMRRANCEVYMFDLHYYGRYSIAEDPYVHFHQVGLWSQNTAIAIRELNLITQGRTFGHIVRNLLNITSRLINILKIDIEAAEWEALEAMVTDPYLDAVGQIAIEVHAFEYGSMIIRNDTSVFLKFTKLLTKLQERGFRIVSYFENKMVPSMVHSNGKSYLSFGEILFVNSNWYNSEFRREGNLRGFNFVIS